MQKLQLAITERLRAEYEDFDVTVPDWLYIILMDELYYTVTLTVTSVCAFGVGLCIGWICTLTL
jgi:hypothetical protein